ncbi:MAG TPA: dihydrofolate reductase [Candidatus Scatomonas pullistercoris]|uniref:Dihydrofolate reductase n=1 Tax=Candidatus Scatomonas pullistercoris TaxID=2840920 RepID=A0A9D1P3E7_9FIRM|nr:dihydrofolate reductase [Candidatus Scatomonas pullistercoris]
MKAILSADRNWGIGCQNKLLISIPSDMKFFRETTTGHTVVMGRRTLESFPGGQPLKNRRNIVLTRNPEYSVKGAEVVHSPEELLKLLEGSPLEDVYVIGGGEVYRLLLPYCDTVYVTKIDFAYQADTFFPNLDESPEWELAEESEEQTCFDIEFTFRTYRRI